MRGILLAAAATCLLLPACIAVAAPLQPALSGLQFLVGSWTGRDGKVAETGGTSRGVSTFTAEAGGGVLLRNDHVFLFDKAGKPGGAFNIIMTIYAEKGAIHADYFDGTHIIHYMSAAVATNKSVAFSTANAPGAPAFRLTYAIDGKQLTVSLVMAPPGHTVFQPIATGTLHKGS